MDKKGNPLPDWEKMEGLPWIEAMKKCPQDAEWHAEGDVFTHTKMVVEALLQSTEYQSLTSADKVCLLLSAILHDVAKPQCTEEENGRIVSPRHAKVGEKMVRRMLWNIDFEAREKICALIRFHGLPLWALEKPQPNAAVIAASLRLNLSHLCILTAADVRGRICQDQAALHERIDFFRELCLENDCLHQTFTFENGHSRFRFFRKKENHPVPLFDDTTFKVNILCGLPGSGKDTFVATQFPDLPVISLDALRIEHKVKHGDTAGLGRIVGIAYEQAKRYAARKQSFVWNATSLTQQLRDRLVMAMYPYNPYVTIHYIETDFANVLEARKDEISEWELDNMRQKLEMPSLDEGHEVRYYWR